MRRPYRLLPDDEMERAAGTPHHGGLCAVATERPIGMMDFVRKGVRTSVALSREESERQHQRSEAEAA